MRFGMGIGLKNARNYNADYALEFNGTDEYLQIASPTDLAGFDPATISGGSAPTGWIKSGSPTITYETTEVGSSGCAKLILPQNTGIYKAGLVSGKKYKITVRYKLSGSATVRFAANISIWSPDVILPQTSQWNTIIRTFTQPNTDGSFYIYNYASSTATLLIESISIKEDQGFDLNRDQEQILHSKNWDFERTLGTELASGTVTIGSKYIVTAGTVEGNAVGTEFLAVTNATTLDANNKVKEIPNLVTNGTFATDNWNKTANWVYDSVNKKYSVSPVGSGVQNLYNSYYFIVGKRYRITGQCLDYVAGSFAVMIGGGTGGYTTIGTVSGGGTFAFDGTITGSSTILLQASADAQLSVDNVHISEIPEWTSTGNHTCDVSTLDKSGTGVTNTQSLLVSASGAGSSGSNYVSLPSANLESCVAGKKYTLQGEARLDPASLTYGSDLASGWNITNWSVANATINDSNTYTTVGVGGVYKTFAITVGKIYKLVYNLSTTAPSVNIFENASTGGLIISLSTGASSGTVYFKASRATAFYLRNNSTGVTDVTTLEIYEADISLTAPTITAQIGTKNVTSSALSIVAGTFTKFVLNFEATSAEVNQDLKLWLSGAGSVFVDNISLTQAYDRWISAKIKLPNSDGGQDIIFSFNGWNASRGNNLTLNGSNAYYSQLSAIDGSGDNKEIRTPKTKTGWENIALLVNRTSSELSLYLDGVLKDTDTISIIGKVIFNANRFCIGVLSYVDLQCLQGQISNLQIIRFENISQSTFNPAITGLQYPTGGGAEEVLRLTFSDGTSFANCVKDYSPKNHSISNPGSTMDLNNRKRVV